jgi:hypothetical protein
MKRNTLYNFLLGVVFVAIAACNSNNGSNSSNKTTTESIDSYFMKATVGDSLFNVSGIREVSGVITPAASTLDIIGSNGSKRTSKYISLGITPYNNTPGTYNIVPGKITGSVCMIAGTIKIAVYGQIILTTATATDVSGSFSFTCKDSTKVSGTFAAPVHTL